MSKIISCEFCSGTETAHAPACPLLHLFFEIVSLGDLIGELPPNRLDRVKRAAPDVTRFGLLDLGEPLITFNRES
jgi:hypothetical protein